MVSVAAAAIFGKLKFPCKRGNESCLFDVELDIKKKQAMLKL
jgi:hypothetical protein